MCITNGFDEQEIKNNINVQSDSGKKFTLSYVGVLEQLRNPEILWEVLNELVTENPEFRADFRLQFAGRVDDRIKASIENSALKNTVLDLGYLSHDAAVEVMAQSDMLLITNFPDPASKGIIPGKIFEYLATGTKILSFGPDGADVETILNKTSAGRHFTYTDTENLKKYLSDIYSEWKTGKQTSNPADISEFSRRNLTAQLAALLNEKDTRS